MSEYRTNREIEVLTLIVQVKRNQLDDEAPELEFRNVYVRTDNFPFTPLTARELEVLYLIAIGMTNKEIAEIFVRSMKTIDSHLRSILSKLGALNRTHAASIAIHYHMITIIDDIPDANGWGLLYPERVVSYFDNRI